MKVETQSGKMEMKFAWIPAGTFLMGSDFKTFSFDYGAKPIHRVVLTKGFYLSIYPVTQAQWKAVMGYNPSHFNQGNDFPVEMVNWDAATAFCNKLRELTTKPIRLPTEAEWEYACAPVEGAFSNGTKDDGLRSLGWFDQTSGKETHSVGELNPNSFGLYDMHGNVWEWCADWFAPYPEKEVTDPKGPNNGTLRVCRGGSYAFQAVDCRAANRGKNPQSFKYSDLGLRVCFSPE